MQAARSEDDSHAAITDWPRHVGIAHNQAYRAAIAPAAPLENLRHGQGEIESHIACAQVDDLRSNLPGARPDVQQQIAGFQCGQLGQLARNVSANLRRQSSALIEDLCLLVETNVVPPPSLYGIGQVLR